MTVDDYSPIYQGDTLTPLSVQFLHNDGTVVNITGATITMKMQLAGPPGAVAEPIGTVINCAGTWNIDNAAQGQAHYQYQSADVATPGTWNLYIVVTIGGASEHFDVKQLTILPSI